MSHRPPWSQLPPLVTDWVQGLLGAPVLSALGQTGGFSTASADRVVAANGRRAFVKAIHADQNAHTVQMHRTEARVAGYFPAGFPAPALLGCLDEDGWVALAFEDIDGRHPHEPWVAEELEATLATLADVARTLTPCPVPDLPHLPEAVAEDFAGWLRVAADPPADLDPWLAHRLPLLTELATAGAAALAGDTLVHLDVRADNALIDRGARVWIVDWPWACRGAAWADALLLLFSVVGPDNVADVDARVDRLLHEHGVPGHVGTAALSGFVSFFVDAARLPDRADLGPVGSHRRKRAAYTTPLLRRRIERTA